ncbi:MAG: agmatine deiminase family protein, partial [Onishia taeanensis]|uniref:agmatine deiminase family protein n=1 Tax=Onishia taeanensis TaxID=284577 RepID=UPI003C79F5F6
MANRLFPEWHQQDAVQLTWPGADSDWAPMLSRIEATLERMVVAIARYQRVLISVADIDTRRRLAATFAHLGVPARRLVFCVVPSDDSWARDHGPIAVERDGRLTLLD